MQSGIFGVGIDLCKVARMEKLMEKQAFLDRVYAPAEQALLVQHRGKARAETAAGNFAAKEAFLKAAHTGLAGFALAEIALLREPSGAPRLAAEGKTAAWLRANGLRAHVSLSHEDGMACAIVVLEAAPPKEEP